MEGYLRNTWVFECRKVETRSRTNRSSAIIFAPFYFVITCFCYFVVKCVANRHMLSNRYTGTVVTNRRGSGNGSIWLDDVICAGTEQSIDRCEHGDWGLHDCTHAEDVAISCGRQSSRPTWILHDHFKSIFSDDGFCDCFARNDSFSWQTVNRNLSSSTSSHHIVSSHANTHSTVRKHSAGLRVEITLTIGLLNAIQLSSALLKFNLKSFYKQRPGTTILLLPPFNDY